MPKYLDQVGLKKVVQSMGAVVDQKVDVVDVKVGAVDVKVDAVALTIAAKLAAVTSADQDQIAIDITDPTKPQLALGAATVTKIETLWTLSNNGAGETMDLILDADIDTIFAEVFV